MIEVSFAADEDLREQCVALLGQLGFEGFWEDEGVLRGYIAENRWSPELLAEIRTTVALIIRSSTHPMPEIQIRSLENRNWNEEWERTIQPIRVTPRIVITPSWHSYTPDRNDIVLTIDPKMSFGTGYHESTRLILRLMERHLRPRARVLDVGTGTGVLAIAAVRLGASAATGIDIDEWSFENARENVLQNGVEDRVTILQGDLSTAPPIAYDLIAANIQKSILLPLLPSLAHSLNRGGVLLLSGLLKEDREAMDSALAAAGFSVAELLEENGWIALAALL